MNLDPLKRAYQVPSLSERSRASIRANVQTTAQAPGPRWRLALAIGVSGLVILLGMPTAKANYLGYWLAGRLRDHKPFTVTITMIPVGTAAKSLTLRPPVVVAVANDVCVMSDSALGRDTQYLFNASHLFQFRPADRRAIMRSSSNSSWLSMLTLPDQVAGEIGKISARKDVRYAGAMTLNGKDVDQWIIRGSTGFDHVVIYIDKQSGEATRMEIPGGNGSITQIFDYDRDPQKALKTIAASKAAIDAVPKLDLDGSKPTIARSISATPIRNFALPKDQLIIYRVEQNRQGDVFVLYTCDGKHKTDEQMGNWIRLTDASGTPWLSDVVDMDFSGLKLNGQFAKAQVFFHPRNNRRLSSVRLFARMERGEFEHNLVVRPMIFKNAIRREFGNFAPTPTLASQPDWIYYSQSLTDTSWLTADAMKLRFINALNSKDLKFAQKVGRQLESNFPKMLSGFFYSQQQLSLGLYHAFRGTGDLVAARDYLKKAIETGKDYGDYDFQTELNAARKVEGL